MRPEEAHLKGISRRWLAVPAVVLSTLSLHAREAGVKPMRPIATLVYLAGAKLEGQRLPAWAQDLSAMVTQDLRDSGLFSLLDPAQVPAGLEPSQDRLWKKAGADYLLRTRVRPTLRGKLLMECECVQLGTQTLLLNKVFVGELQAVHRMAHRLADFVVGRITGTPGVADSRILFSRQTGSGVREIFSATRDGQDLRQLTAFGSLSTCPALSADGKLALVTYKGGPPQIWGQARAGGPMTKLYPRAGQGGRELSDLAWSPDGSRLAFVQEDRQGGSGIHVLDLKTGWVSQWTEEGRSARSPSWKPDGTELAYLSNRSGVPQVYAQSANGGQVRALTRDPGQKTFVAWSPLGDRIAYVAQAEASCVVCTLAPDGGEKHQVEAQAGSIESLCWAPDGRWLLLGRKSGLQIAALDGTVRDLPGGFKACQTPQWTRNGSPLASLSAAAPSAPNPAAPPKGGQPIP